jgi:hypothetical protein
MAGGKHEMQQSELLARSDAVLAELRDCLTHVDAGAFRDLASALLAARRVVLHGLGREGLQMKGLAINWQGRSFLRFVRAGRLWNHQIADRYCQKCGGEDCRRHRGER